jgi:cold shock CspA family protein
MVLPDVRSMLSKAYFIGMQDDHDYGPDDQYGGVYRSFPEGRRAYTDLVPGTRPLPGPAYRSWRIGDVLFCLLDCRWHSDPKYGPYENGSWRSLLGTAQREWLYSTVKWQQARVNVILSPISFNSPSTLYHYGPAERAEMATRLSAAPGTTIICGGDIHASSFGRGPGRLLTFTACPLFQSVHHRPVFTESLWNEGGFGGVTPPDEGFDVFGHISIDTTAGAMALQVIEDNGTVRFATTVPV